MEKKEKYRVSENESTETSNYENKLKDMVWKPLCLVIGDVMVSKLKFYDGVIAW